MKATKKTPVQTREAEIIDAVHALAHEKDISEDMLFGAIEEALKAAYKKKRFPQRGRAREPFRYA